MEEIFEIRSCREILANYIKVDDQYICSMDGWMVMGEKDRTKSHTKRCMLAPSQSSHYTEQCKQS